MPASGESEAWYVLRKRAVERSESQRVGQWYTVFFA